MGCCCSSEDDGKRGTQRREDDGGRNRTRSRHSRGRSPGRQSDRPSRDHGLSTTSKASKRKEKCRYVAQWDYKANSKAELTLAKGDVIEDAAEECDAGPEWVFASKPGHGTGYAPRAWLAQLGTYETEPWFFGEMKRQDAEKILGDMTDGTYLVRSRTTKDGLANLALSVAFNNTAKHYRLKVVQESGSSKGSEMTTQRFYLNKRKFSTMPEMIETYKSNPEGICCKLTTPIPRIEPARIELPADVQKNWQEIPRRQIHIERDIGSGNFGVVKKGVWKPTPEISLEVAVKELKKGATEAKATFLAEAVAMKNLVHVHLVKLYGIVSAEEPYWIITEFVKDGSLKSWLRKQAKAGNIVVEPKQVEIATQIADGMRYMEMKKMVHRDLAARNVLVDVTENELDKVNPTVVCKIADFGMTKLAKRGKIKETKGMELAVKWTAPEALKDLRFSSASDVWSFGITLHEIFTQGGDPYKGIPPKRVKDELLRSQTWSLPRDELIPENIYGLMESCCQFSPSSRITFQDIYDSLDKYYDKDHDPYERYRQ